MGQLAVKRKPKDAIATMRAMLSNEDPVFAYDDRPLVTVVVDMYHDIPVVMLNGRKYSMEEYQSYKVYHRNTEFHEIRIEEMIYPEGWEEEYAARKANEMLAQEAIQAQARAAKDDAKPDPRKEELARQDAENDLQIKRNLARIARQERDEAADVWDAQTNPLRVKYEMGHSEKIDHYLTQFGTSI